MFLRNVCWLSTGYMTLYPRRQNFSKQFSSLPPQNKMLHSSHMNFLFIYSFTIFHSLSLSLWRARNIFELNPDNNRFLHVRRFFLFPPTHHTNCFLPIRNDRETTRSDCASSSDIQVLDCRLLPAVSVTGRLDQVLFHRGFTLSLSKYWDCFRAQFTITAFSSCPTYLNLYELSPLLCKSTNHLPKL
jgi:hypothetical protein